MQDSAKIIAFHNQPEYPMRNIFFVTATAVCVLVCGSAQAQNLLQDAGFETTSIAFVNRNIGGGTSFAYPLGYYNGWTYAGRAESGSGLVNGSSTNGILAFGQPTGYGGRQYAFLQASSTLSQSFTTSTAGILNISWLEASRSGNITIPDTGEQRYRVQIDGVVYGESSTLTGQNFRSLSLTSAVPVAAGNHTLTFAGLSRPSHTAFIDNVSVTLAPLAAVPEPETWALTTMGIGLMGALLRRRKRTGSATGLAA